MKVGILGATGYTGQELLRILNQHPEAQVVYLGSSSSAGKSYEEIYPHWNGSNYALSEEEVPEVDVLFAAMPHGITAQRAEGLLQRGIKLIDLGADFRLVNYQEYESWYKTQHASPHLLQHAVYGLPELYRDEIQGKGLIANPGCYPTASLLALVPLLQKQLIKNDPIIIDAKSGVSGAGRGIAQPLHFAEVNENFKAYGVGEHRHTPEIEQQLSKAANEKVLISFTPHLVPMNRGILATIYVQPYEGVGEEDLRNTLAEAYEQEEFVHLLPKGTWPQTKYAYGSNHAFLQLKFDQRTGRAILVSAIDNLIKGASGQAVQNMNILFGLPETMGLGTKGLWP
ncbi:MAG: N-acetyl-gamma-glutamyl-phosphate reductase [Peptococcaceae bacterium]|nr:N-acetyl-gamma-glutamyl-phosphate reductase [Peptococcaceae bacterium]